MMDDLNIQVEFLELMMKRNQQLADAFGMISEVLQKKEANNDGNIIITEDEMKEWHELTGRDLEKDCDLQYRNDSEKIKERVDTKMLGNIKNFINNEDSKIYLICNGVEACCKMIRIGDNFSSKALRNIAFGKHTYLLGKNEVCRFICDAGAIKGVYWNRDKEIFFEFGFDLESDGYYFDELYAEQFNKVAKIITFVELGDIDVIELEKGRNNGKSKKDGKVTNTSVFTVFVVDSSWNQLIIRTDGFAVMGHFRLQPCGAGFIDRKLIWINAFEKHGYSRRPKAEIIH